MRHLVLPMAAALAVSFGVAVSTPANAFGGLPKDQRLFVPAYDGGSHFGADVAQVTPVHARKRYYRRHSHYRYPRYRHRYYYDRPAFGFYAYPRYRHRYSYYDHPYYYDRGPRVGFSFGF